MAGDVGFSEQVVVVPVGAADLGAVAAQVLDETSGRVSHQYGDRVLVTEETHDSTRVARDQTPQGSVATAAADLPDELTTDLDEAEELGLEAFALRSSAEYEESKAQRPLADEPWDNDQATSPDHVSAVEAGSEDALAGGATSARLTGSVAVGIIIVEGPTDALTFSAAERVKVIAEVQNGLSWLGAQSSPQGVSFKYDIHVVTLATEPGPDDLSFGDKEALWRDPAMASLGYGAGMAGVTDYVQDIRTAKGTTWAYCAFFTKYPVGWFAYASIGGPRLVMDYANDGWGPDNIDRVFAHETGHVFNAPDEYAASGCNCGGSWGHFNVANGNCANCAAGGGVDCIMKSNSWTMCAWTPWHLGFPQGLRYSGVFSQGSGGYGLWLNASWPYFVKKWQDWARIGLRLEDIEITRIGNKTLYSGVWRQGTGGYGLWVNATWSSFIQKWQQWSAQGLRLVDFEITRYGSQTRYSGVFKQGTGGYGLWVNATWSSFIQKWQQWSAQGLRLIDFEITRYGSQTRYSGVFKQGTGGYGLWVNATWSSFIQKWQQWSGQGLRLIDFEMTRYGSQTRYSGVFRQGSGPYALWVNSDWTSFREKWEQWSGQGMRLVDLELSVTDVESAASPFPASTEESIGFGVSSLGDDIEAGGDDPGFGGLYADDGSDDDEAGFGMSSLDADAENGAGFGDLYLTSGSDDDEAGFGMSSLDADAEDGAGFGDLYISDSSEGDEAGFGMTSLDDG